MASARPCTTLTSVHRTGWHQTCPVHRTTCLVTLCWRFYVSDLSCLYHQTGADHRPIRCNLCVVFFSMFHCVPSSPECLIVFWSSPKHSATSWLVDDSGLFSEKIRFPSPSGHLVWSFKLLSFMAYIIFSHPCTLICNCCVILI